MRGCRLLTAVTRRANSVRSERRFQIASSSLETGSGRLAGRFHTLKFKLMALLSAVLVLVVGLPVAAFVYRIDRDYHDTVTTMLETTTGFVYEHLTQGLMENDPLVVQEALVTLGADPRIDRLRLLDPEGQILFSSHPQEIGENVFLTADSVFFHSDGRGIESFSKVGDTYVHHHALFVEERCVSCHATSTQPIGTLDVYASFIDSEAATDYVKYFSIGGGLLIIVILWITTNLLYESQIETKLRSLLEGFQELAQGKLGTRVNLKGNDEISLLATRFNETVERLESARKKEEAYYQEKLERADRLVTLGEIAAEIAHEVNNPAGIILSRAELIREDLAELGGDDSTLEDLDIVIQQTGRIADITRSILHYARKRHRALEPTDLGAVIGRSFKVLEPRLKKANATVRLSLPDTPLTIQADGDQLEQVFCNLINNSLDAVHNRPPELHVRCVPYEDESGVTGCTLVFEDNGPGIPEALGDQVFNPFFTTKSDGAGTGLGLFIARNIIHAHGGSITLDPQRSSGARFLIQLPSRHGHA